jgi:hypothetical protein
MNAPSNFGEVMEVVEALSDEDKELLVDTLQRRKTEARREELAQTAREAREEHTRGETTPLDPDELTEELLA